MTESRPLAWVTGASEGIGRALVLELVRRGHRVVATARNAERLAALAAEAATLGGTVIPAAADVTDPSALETLIAGIESEHGPVGLAVLNAGVYTPMRARAFDVAICKRTVDVNLMGVINGLGPLLPRMLARKDGRIALVASVAGYAGLPNSMAYGATKAALINLAECLRLDCEGDGVIIQVVNPGFVETAATAVNDFEMPALMSAGAAAVRIADGLQTNQFEIVFPKRFTTVLKFLGLLPYPIYFPLVKRFTGVH
jgi:short-subunit dehydrogenase